jgi:hypothetical protein
MGAVGVVIAYTMGCLRGGQDPPVTLAGEELGVRLGMTANELSTARPAVKFAPYVGWVDSLRSSVLFDQALFALYREPVEAELPAGGQLWSVRLTAKKEAGPALLDRLIRDLGPPNDRGCLTVATGSRFRIMVWPNQKAAVAIAVPEAQAGAEDMRSLVGYGGKTESPLDLLGSPGPIGPCP